MANPYDQFDEPKPATGNATVAPVAVPGVIKGAPKTPPPPTAIQSWSTLTPDEVKATGLDPKKVWQRNGAGGLREVGNAGPEAAKGSGSNEEQIRQIRMALDNLNNIESEVTGAMFGQGVGNVAGTEGFQKIPFLGQRSANIAGGLEMVQGDLINQVRLQMAEQGIVVGASQLNTEKEASRQAASIANLSQTQDETNFLRGLQNAREFYAQRLAKVVGADPNDPEFRKQYGIAMPGGQSGGNGSGGDNPGGGDGGGDGLDVTVTYTGPNEYTNGGPAEPGGDGMSWRDVARGIGMGVGDLVEGAGSSVGLVADPFGQMMYDALGYDQRYNTGEILRSSLGLPDSPDSMVSRINKFGAAAMTGAGLARYAGSALQGVPGMVMENLGRTPIRDTVAGAGAGAGSYAGEQTGIPGAEYAGALAGGLAGYGGASAGFNALLPRQMSQIGAASARQGVDLLPADVSGPAIRGVTAATKMSPLSSGPVVKQAQENTAQLASAVRRTAEGQGDIVTTDVAGENIRKAAQQYSKQTGERAARMYDKAFELSRGVRIKPLGTIQEMDAQIARLRESPTGAASAKELQGYRDLLEKGVTVQGLRDMRSALSQGVYDGKLRSGQDVALYKRILGNVATDIEAGLNQAGRSEAASLFKRADAFYSARVEHIDKVLQPIIGKDGTKGGEQVLQAVESMARGGSGGNARLSRLLGNMSEQDAGQVRAVIIDRLGKATAGAQDAEGAAFSAGTFLTNWNRMTPQAKASLFSDSGLRSNLNDIAKIAEGMKASRSMENFSNTAGALAGNVGIGLAAGYANPVYAIIGAGGQYLTGKLMASPGFARMLAKMAKQPPVVANRTLREEIGVLAKSEPLIANDLRNLQQFLGTSFAQSPARAAAEGQNENNGGGVPPQ